MEYASTASSLLLFAFVLSPLQGHATDRTIEMVGAQHAHALSTVYQELGARASEGRNVDQTLRHLSAAATLSLYERELSGSAAPIYCGSVSHAGGQVAVGKEYCAASMQLCSQVIGAAQVARPHTSNHTTVTGCHKKD